MNCVLAALNLLIIVLSGKTIKMGFQRDFFLVLAGLFFILIAIADLILIN